MMRARAWLWMSILASVGVFAIGSLGFSSRPADQDRGLVAYTVSAESMSGLPEWFDSERMLARVRISEQVGKESPPLLILAQDPLPDGAVAIAKLSRENPVANRVVIAASGFNDRRLDRVLSGVLAARVLDLEGGVRDPSVSITWYADGRLVDELASGVRHEQVIAPEGAKESTQRAKKVLALAAGSPLEIVPGVGPARAVQLTSYWQ